MPLAPSHRPPPATASRAPHAPAPALLLALALVLPALGCAGDASGRPDDPPVVAAAPDVPPAVPAPPPAAAARPARNVILVIGDGMQLAHEIAASRFLTGRDDGLVFHDPSLFDWAGHATTWDVSTYDLHAAAAGRPSWSPSRFDPVLGYDPVRGGTLPYPLASTPDDGYFLGRAGGKPPATDSAAAATALATGQKTAAGNLSWLPGDADGGALVTLAEAARARLGAAIGVVSTVPFTHATPAAFVAHARARTLYAAIGAEIVHSTQPDVVIGGGFPGWRSPPDQTFVARAEHDALRAGSTGYTYVERTAGVDGGEALRAAAARVPPGGRLFGLFGGPGGNLESPVPRRDGSGGVDRGARENPTLADATRAALEVLARDPDGFFVMVEQGDIDWANHAGDLPRLIGTIWDLDQAVRAALAFVDRPDDAVTWENTLLLVTSDHGNNYLRFGPGPALGKGVLPAVNGSGNPIDPREYTLYPLGGAGAWNHTNELVTVYARGGTGRALLEARAGSWYPGTHLVDNTQLWEVMAEFLGVR